MDPLIHYGLAQSTLTRVIHMDSRFIDPNGHSDPHGLLDLLRTCAIYTDLRDPHGLALYAQLILTDPLIHTDPWSTTDLRDPHGLALYARLIQIALSLNCIRQKISQISYNQTVVVVESLCLASIWKLPYIECPVQPKDC